MNAVIWIRGTDTGTGSSFRLHLELRAMVRWKRNILIFLNIPFFKKHTILPKSEHKKVLILVYVNNGLCGNSEWFHLIILHFNVFWYFWEWSPLNSRRQKVRGKGLVTTGLILSRKVSTIALWVSSREWSAKYSHTELSLASDFWLCQV